MQQRSLIRRSARFTLAAFLIAVAFGITLPLIALRVSDTGVSGAWIGLNAAMPALGWIIGAALLPWLQIRLAMAFKRLVQVVLAIAIVALVGLRFADGYAEMTALRFLFGGAIGVVFRCIEFWINDVSTNEERGRNLGTYNILFMIAIIVGSLLQPALGRDGWVAFGPPVLLLVAGLVLVELWSGEPAPVIDLAAPPAALGIVLLVPVALATVLAYGLFETVPTSLMQVYLVRNHLGDATAAYALTAVAAGSLVLQYPIAALSDRIGRALPLLLCACVVSMTSAAIPSTLNNEALLLAVVALWGGAGLTSYSLALAMIGDRFKGGRLVVANAAFGVVYAVGSIVGPLLNGFAIDQLETHGLMVSLATIYATLTILVVLTLFLSRKRSDP